MRVTAVVAWFADQGVADLGLPEVTAWIERGWIRPDYSAGVSNAVLHEIELHEIDIARLRLIHDLRSLMRIEDETIPLVLSLLDQVYDLRAGLSAVLRAVEAQPQPVRQAILAALE